MDIQLYILHYKKKKLIFNTKIFKMYSLNEIIIAYFIHEYQGCPYILNIFDI